ncbi:MAG: tRNA (cytidine(56)-2'-O)-methyltransferase [Candidatus Diapherotrites archaeon]
MKINVLRYGHRHVRDFRVTSHCCLVARAFGVEKIEIIGEKDTKIIETLTSINEKWGDTCKIEFFENWKERLKFYKKLGFTIIHLTMYGIPIQEIEKEIKTKKNILVIIGSQKVEREVYEMSDYNISITTQPHSEIAALAVFLDRVQEGKELTKQFNGKIKIIPTPKGKKILKKT